MDVERALMTRWALWVWALASMAFFLAATPPCARATPKDASVSASLAAEEKESCTRNLKIIYDAIQAYQFDHKDLPNWLSDLVPDYLADGNVLICPVCRRTGETELPPLADPRLACSYVFEFSPVPVGLPTPGQPKHTRREWKRRQMGLIGSVVPLVRCRHHDPLLNLGFNGAIYGSPGQWELLFTNKIRAAELSARAIFGLQEVPEDEVPAPVVSSSQPSNPGTISSSSQPIDLSSFYTSPMGTNWLGTPGDDLSSLSSGRQNFGGVDFQLGGVVQLRGKSAVWSRFPEQVKGIPVHHRCQHLYFLHAAAVEGEAQDGDQIGSYLVHLPNSQLTLEIPIYYGRSVGDWHQAKTESSRDKELKIAWTGQNPASKRTGKPIRLFLTAWNLAPGVEIDSMDFVSAEKKAAPFLLAISFD